MKEPGKHIELSYTLSTRSSKNRLMEMFFYKQVSKCGLAETISAISYDIKEWVNQTKGQLNAQYIKEKSVRFLFKEVELFEQHADNVLKNEITCRAFFRGYKISRIVKRMLSRKQLCQTKETI